MRAAIVPMVKNGFMIERLKMSIGGASNFQLSDKSGKEPIFFQPSKGGEKKFSDDKFKEYLNYSIGKQILFSFKNLGTEIPKKIKEATMIFEENFYKKSNLDKYILKFITDTGCDLKEWNADEAKIVLESVDPRALLGAISAAVKDNSAAIGKEAVLFDVKSIEAIPEVKKYMEAYIQRHR